MNRERALTTVPMWSASHPGGAALLWLTSVLVATAAGGRSPAVLGHAILHCLPVLLLCALLGSGSLIAAGAVAALAAGTGIAAGGIAAACGLASTSGTSVVIPAATALSVVYTYVLLHRFRAERVKGVRPAVWITAHTAGRTVVLSGLLGAVPAAVLVWCAPRAVALVALAALVAIGTALAGALTVVPALLAGYRAPAPSRPSRLPGALARLVVDHPALVLLLAGILALGPGVVVLSRYVPVTALGTAAVPVLAVLPVAALLPLGRFRAAMLTGVPLRGAVAWAVRDCAGLVTGCALATTGVLLGFAAATTNGGPSVGWPAVLALPVFEVAVGVLAVPAVLVLAGRLAQRLVSAPSAAPQMLRADDRGDGGGAGCRT